MSGEITALLLTGQLDAAWVCDELYVQNENQLSLLRPREGQGRALGSRCLLALRGAG